MRGVQRTKGQTAERLRRLTLDPGLPARLFPDSSLRNGKADDRGMNGKGEALIKAWPRWIRPDPVRKARI